MIKGIKKKELLILVVLVFSLVFLYRNFLKKNILEGQSYGDFFSLSQAKVKDLKYNNKIGKLTTCDEILQSVSNKQRDDLIKMWNYYPSTSIYHNHGNQCGPTEFDSEISTTQIPFCSYFGYGSHNPAFVCTKMDHHDLPMVNDDQGSRGADQYGYHRGTRVIAGSQRVGGGGYAR